MNRYSKLILAGLCLIISCAMLYYYASESPDPIEFTLQNSGKESKDSFSIFKDYELPFIHSKFITGVLLIIFGGGLSAVAIFFVLKKMTGSK